MGLKAAPNLIRKYSVDENNISVHTMRNSVLCYKIVYFSFFVIVIQTFLILIGKLTKYTFKLESQNRLNHKFRVGLKIKPLV